MRRTLRLFLCLAVLFSALMIKAPAQAAVTMPADQAVATLAVTPVPGPCVDGVLPSGALSRMCIPSVGWNGDLVIFAHGYTAFNVPLDFQHLTTPDGMSVPNLVQNLGFAFATTSYRRNGLAILEGSDDVRELALAFRAAHGVPPHSYVVGVSEGGIITTLVSERWPNLFSGGLAGCGPNGDFRQQLNYYGDVRVLFDYFFPGVVPGSPISIPTEVINNWDSVYLPRIRAAIAADPAKAKQLVIASKAVVDFEDPAVVETTILRMMWYNVFATNDGVQQLGGNPLDNMTRIYTGSSNDTLLNQRVQRFRADAAALQKVKSYETTGRLSIPLVILHTTGDELIPYWHALLYKAKATFTGKGQVLLVPVPRQGHCNFTSVELMAAFGRLLFAAE